MKEEEIERGDCGLPTRSLFFFFFLRFCRTWTKQYLITSQADTPPDHSHGPVVYPANAFDSRLRGDQVPCGSKSDKVSKKNYSNRKSCDLRKQVACENLYFSGASNRVMAYQRTTDHRKKKKNRCWHYKRKIVFRSNTTWLQLTYLERSFEASQRNLRLFELKLMSSHLAGSSAVRVLEATIFKQRKRGRLVQFYPSPAASLISYTQIPDRRSDLRW